MKKKYLAPMSAQMMVNLTIMSGSGDKSADLTPGGQGGLTPACTPGRKVYI